MFENSLEKSIEWKVEIRNNLTHPINDADYVVAIGSDGTLQQVIHLIDDNSRSWSKIKSYTYEFYILLILV